MWGMDPKGPQIWQPLVRQGTDRPGEAWLPWVSVSIDVKWGTKPIFLWTHLLREWKAEVLELPGQKGMRYAAMLSSIFAGSWWLRKQYSMDTCRPNLGRAWELCAVYSISKPSTWEGRKRLTQDECGKCRVRGLLSKLPTLHPKLTKTTWGAHLDKFTPALAL